MDGSKPPDPGGSGSIIQFDNVCQNEINLKRKKGSKPSSVTLQVDTPLVPRANLTFLIIKKADGNSLSKVSPFLIDKILVNSCGTVKSAKKLRDGTMLVEVFSTQQGEKLCKNLPKNIYLPLVVEPHKTLNNVRGVITSPDLDSVPLEEIKEHLKYQGVIDLYRIIRKKNGLQENTNSYVVTLSLPKLPERLKIGYYSVQMRPYIPLPLRCRKCYKFNHVEANCPADVYTCPDCSKSKHDSVCIDPKKCVNCGAAHSTLDRDCPRWVIEKKVMEIKTLQNISYTEAKRKIISRGVEQAKSYASLSHTKQKITKDQGTQCDFQELAPTPVSPPKPLPVQKPINAAVMSPERSPKKTSKNRQNEKMITLESNKIGKNIEKSPRDHETYHQSREKKQESKKIKNIDEIINTQEENRLMWVDDWTISGSENDDDKISSSSLSTESNISGSGTKRSQIKKKKKGNSLSS